MKNTKNSIEQKDTKRTKTASKKKHSINTAIVNVYASFNNTIVSISESNGNIVCWSSSGSLGFKGSKKATPYAAQVATQKVIGAAKERGLQSVYIKVRGPGVGREAALRAIQASGITVFSIKDITYFPHNGCRPAKKRRV